MGRFSEPTTKLESSAPIPSSQVQIGTRCRIQEDDGSIERRGVIRYVGPTKFGKRIGSIWVGVELDEPLGKNNGS